MLDASGPAYREAIISFCTLCSLVGAPLSWTKTAGGDTISWVGFEILNRTYKLGISERRCQWFVRWTREVAESDHVQMTNFEEGLDRVMHVVGALEYEAGAFFLGARCRSGRERCEKAWCTSGQDQETAPQTIGRAPQDDGSLVMLDVVKKVLGTSSYSWYG